MKITNLELSIQFIPALRELSTLKTSARIAFNAVKTIKVANAAVETFEAARKTLIETRCEMKDGKPVTEGSEYVFATPEIKAEVTALITELQKEEITLDIYPVKISDFGSEIISPATIMGLGDFITEN